MPENISMEEFLSLTPNVEEKNKKEENIISKEEFLALGNQTDSSIETQTTESNVMESGSDDGSLELPQVTMKDVDVPERQAINRFKKKFGGLGFEFDQAGFGTDKVIIYAPPKFEGQPKEDREKLEIQTDLDLFGFSTYSDKLWGASSKQTAQDVNDFVKKHSQGSPVNPQVYASAWNTVDTYKVEGKDGKSKKIKDLSSDELGEHMKSAYNAALHSENLPGIKEIFEEINVTLEDFTKTTIDDLKNKYDLTDQKQVELANKELKQLITKKQNELFEQNQELKNIQEGVLKAVESRFSSTLDDKLRKEAEDMHLPSWITNFDSDYIRQGYITAAIKFPKALKEVNILHKGIDLKNTNEEIEELKKLDPTANYISDEPTGFKTNADRIKYLESYKANLNKDIGFKLAESQEYQKKLEDVRVPTIFGKDISDPDLTIDEWQGMLGDQTVQMISAVLTMGGSTYIQEGGGAALDIIEIEAAKKMFPPTREGIQIVEVGSKEWQKQSSEDIEKALEAFRKLPKEERAAAMADILDKGEANLNPAVMVGATNAGLDLVSNFFVIGKATKFAPKSLGRHLIRGRLGKFLSEGYETVGKDLGKASFMEFITETSQEGTSITGVGVSTGYYGNKDANIKRLAEAGGQALLSTGPLVGAGKVATTTTKELRAKTGWFGGEDLKLTRQSINQIKKEYEQYQKDGVITIDQLDEVYTELEAQEDFINNTKYKNLSNNEKIKVIDNLVEIANLKKDLTKLENENKKTKKQQKDTGGLNPNTIQNDIKGEIIKNKIKELQLNNLKEIWKNDLTTNLEFAEWINNQTEGFFADKAVMTFDNVEDARNFIEGNNLEQEAGRNPLEVFLNLQSLYNGDVNGANLGNVAVIVNDNVRKNIDANYGDWSSSNVVHHEAFHFILDAIPVSELQTVRNQVISELEASTDPKIQAALKLHKDKMDLYTKDKRTREYNEEWFAVLSDAMRGVKNSDISLENGVALEGVGRIFGGLFQGVTKKGFDFTKFDAQNALEFIKKYNDFNGKSPGLVLPGVKGKVDVQLPKKKGIDFKLSKAVGSQTTVKEDLFKETNNALIEALEMYGMKNPERLLSEDINVRKQLAKEWEALGDSRFWIGTVIGEKWRRFIEVNYLQKRDKAANYDLYKDQILDVVTTGIEKGDNGIPFLVRSWKPAEEGGRSLTSHIFGEIETRLMAKGGIIDRKFPQFDKFTSAIDMSRDDGGMDIAGDLDVDTVLAAEERKRKRKENLEEDRYRKLIGIDDKFATEIKNEIRDVLLSGDLGLISDFAWTQRFSKAAQKKLFKIIKDEMKDYEAFLKKTRKPFVKHAHTSDLVQMEKNEKNKIFTKLKAVNASPEKIKIALLEGLIQPFEVKSMTQGPNIYEKVDTKEQEFIDFMKVRGRKDAFVKNNINIMAMDAVFDVLLNQTVKVGGKQVRVLDEFIRQQREKGLPHVSNVLGIVKERINRDQDVKFSKTVRGFNPFELKVFYGKLDVFGDILNVTNVGDEAAVYQAVYSVWGEDYNQTKLKALSNDLFKLVKRYATIDKNHTNLKTQPEQKLNEYLHDNITAAALEMNLAEFLDLKNDKGKFIKISNAFDEIGRINNQRAEIVTLGRKLIKKYGEQIALMMMVHASGMYATSTKIGRGKFKVNEKGIVYEVTPKDIGKEKFGDQRYQVFDGKKDFNKNVLKKIFPNIKLTEAGNLKKIQEVTVKGEKVEIDTSLLAEKSKEAMEDRDFKARKAQAKLSELFVRDMAQHYKDQIKKGALDKTDFAMLMMSMASNMQSPLKRAANLKYIYKDKKGKKYKGELRYEHMIPTNYMVMKITDAYMNDGEIDLDALFEEYTVAVIPTTMDDVLEEMGYQYVMPIGFEVGQSARVRYYNMSTYGHPDLYAIESIDPKDKGKVYGEGIANIKFSRNINKFNTLNNAIVEARKIKFSSKPRGITVLDFDDTLATTKSGVRATMPNPDGTPKPNRKVIFLAGGAGSGKSNVVKQLGLEDQGFKIVNQDISLEWLKKNSGLPADMRDLTKEQKSTLGKLQAEARRIAKRKMMKFKGNGNGVVVDGTGGSINVMTKLVNEFKEKGYDVSMLFVETSLDVALQRNKARKERSLLDVIVRKNHEAVQGNKDGFKEMFGNRFMQVNTDNLTMKDPMPSDLVSKMDDFVSGYEKRRLDAEEFASEGADLLAQGAEFDFSEFNVVTEGQTAPLFNKALKLQKKFGNEDMFVLTARPPESAPHIFEFLKANGLNIPLKNITGLGNSTAEAKALWMADKVGEGYNDFYFADDALQNVQAVQNMLDQFDVKSKVQQAKVKFSKGMNTEFNNILEDVTGIESKKRFSAIKARKRGESKGKFRFFIPPSHEDFVGLLYNFIGKGKEGNKHRDFFEEALVRPLNRADRELNTAKQAIANDYKSLNKEFENVKKKLNKKTPDGDFTYQDAIRVYLWDKHDYNIPGLSKTDQQGLVDLVMNDVELQTYAETLNVISKQEAYVNPTESWEAGDIRIDLDDATGRVGREQFFAEFFENADVIFSQENLNKIEAAYGADMVTALKDILYRTKTGRNRPSGQNALVNKFLNYLNGSVASTMFFNIRSAVLQQMSMVNFINFADNNIFAAAKAFANQPQYWADYATIFNSDFMKQRRGGIMTDVNGAELAASVKNAANPTQAVIKKLLELGFLPTQIGDNNAIALGGATYYRNRINTYLKQGLNQKEAESKAWTDFQKLAEETQQSAKPWMVSMQQASPLGKVILAFQNVTSQFNRLGKKAFLDLKNRRISPEYRNASNPQFQSDLGNISRIAYYFAIQNLIFYSLQSALFMVMFDDDDDDERWLKKRERMIMGSIDSVLRGTGVWGAAAATLKNMAIKWHEQREKGYNADESAVLMEMLNVSPPLGIKARKLVNAEKTLNYNRKVIDEMETFDIDNPQWSAVTNYVEATTNVPLNRLYNKTQNVRESLNNQHTAFERALMFSGWSKWNLGIGDSEKIKEIKEKTKSKKKKKKHGGRKILR